MIVLIKMKKYLAVAVLLFCFASSRAQTLSFADFGDLVNLTLPQVENILIQTGKFKVNDKQEQYGQVVTYFQTMDKDKKPVRSIALWYAKTKYLNEMQSWYDAYYSKFSEADQNLISTTSATRSAGSYTLKWDGKNDKGELVKLGTYTIMIEAAREHGTHQLMTQEIDFTKTPKAISLSGNIEIASASLDYVKKTDGK